MSRENLPYFAPLLKLIDTQQKYHFETRKKLEERNNLYKINYDVDIHLFCVPLLVYLIYNQLVPFTSCQGFIDLDQLPQEEHYNAEYSLVYNLETQKISYKYSMHEKYIDTLEDGEIVSNAYLAIKINSDLAEKL